MAKVLIEADILEEASQSSHKIKTAGIFNNNEIIYHDGDILVTLIISDNKIEMKRKHLDYEIFLIFVANTKTEGYYHLTNLNTNIKLDILTNRMYIGDYKLVVDYQLVTGANLKETFLFSLSYTIKK